MSRWVVLGLAAVLGCSSEERASESADAAADHSDGGTAGVGGAGGGGNAGGGGGGGAGRSIAECPSFAEGTSLGSVENPAVVEASGLVASRKQPGVIWTHNDSGDGPRLFALGSDGKALGTFALSAAQAVDWEDLALGPGPEPNVDYLYAGDIGDNAAKRPGIVVYRVVEPTLGGSSGEQTLSDVAALPLEYPDGKAYDAEALLSDPASGDLWIVTKSLSGVAHLFRAAAPLAPEAPVVLQHAGSVELGVGMSVTGGDVSASGHAVIVRTYGAARLFRRPPSAPLSEAFTTEPCTVPVVSEPQGEAIAFAGDESGYFSLSEGAQQPIWFFAKQ